MPLQVISCVCSSSDHIILWNYDKEEQEVYVTIALDNMGFWYRFCESFKYLFNLGSVKNRWACPTLGRTQVLQLRQFCEEALHNGLHDYNEE
jgi:hypothetical protein